MLYLLCAGITHTQITNTGEVIMRFFNCYSVPLKNHLLKTGFRYASVGINPKTNNTYWMFVNDGKFKQALDNWTITKPIL